MVTKPPVTRTPAQRSEDDGTGRAPAIPVPDSEERPADPAAAGGVAATGSRRGPSALRARARATLRIIRSNPTGRIALKVGVGIVGAVVVLVGLALVPLPGPGWALVILGLAIWAIEFAWAKHLLRFTRAQVHGWTRWVTRQSWPVRILIGLVGMAFVATVFVLSLRYSFGIDVVGEVWDYVTTH